VKQELHVNGKIIHMEGHRILNLWGTHYEMGFAHGYLMGDEIMEMIEEYGLGSLIPPYWYQAVLLPLIQTSFELNNEYRLELRGMYRGMQKAGTDIYIEDLGRNLILDDLYAINLIPDISRYGCSAAFGWGAATANDPVLSGGSVMVRDLDWGNDPTGLLNTRGTIMVFQSSSPGEKGLVSISWPGMISVLTGFSSDGIGAAINYGNHNYYYPPYPPGCFEGVGFAIRDGLEDRDFDGDGYETHLDVYEAVSSTPQLSSFEISLISSFPVPGHPGTGAGAVLEINNSGFALRKSSNNMDYSPYLNSTDLLAVTNHHRLLYSPVYCFRYSHQVSELSADFEVDTDELWEIESAISNQYTMHMTAFRPNLLDMYVAFNETFQGAAASKKNHYLLDDLFPNH